MVYKDNGKKRRISSKTKIVKESVDSGKTIDDFINNIFAQFNIYFKTKERK
jgi:hypothetical protein